MALADEPVLSQAVAEVRYDNGVVYLDKCGSIMIALEDKIGKPFVGSVPGMEAAELRSKPDRLVVRYGPKNFIVQQDWAETPVRSEQVGSTAWNIISGALGLRSMVTRCGVRFMFLWGIDTVSEAEERLAGSGLFTVSPVWSELFGVPKRRALITVATRDDRQLRAGLDIVETKTEAEIKDSLKKYAPPVAILLDLDFFLEGSPRMALDGASLREYMRSSWTIAKDLSTRVGEALRG